MYLHNGTASRLFKHFFKKFYRFWLEKWSDPKQDPEPVQLFWIRPGQKVPDPNPQRCKDGSSLYQCCGSGSWIGDLVPFLTSGSGIQNGYKGIPGSYFRELINHFVGLKHLNSLMRIRDGKKFGSNQGWKKFGSRDENHKE